MLLTGDSPYGLAVLVGTPSGHWHPGTGVYALCPRPTFNLAGYLMPIQFVVVATSPAASDHGKPETTVFACKDRQGNLFARQGLDDGGELLEPQHRIVGRCDAAAALAALEDGYGIVVGVGPLPGCVSTDRRDLDLGGYSAWA